MKPNLGQLEQDVLLAVYRLEDNAYTLTVQRMLKDRARRSVALGAIYTTLSRLEKQGLLQSQIGGATKARKGRPKRLYKLTGAGADTLNNAFERQRRLWNGISVPVSAEPREDG